MMDMPLDLSLSTGAEAEAIVSLATLTHLATLIRPFEFRGRLLGTIDIVIAI